MKHDDQNFSKELALLKKQRADEYMPTPFFRLNLYIMRYKNLRAGHSLLAVCGYVCHRIAVKCWRIVVGSRFNPMKLKMPTFTVAEQLTMAARKKMYAIRIAGGLGDALVVARFVRDFQQHTHHTYGFDVYFYSPTGVTPFFKNIKGFNSCMTEDVFMDAVPGYVFALFMSHHITLFNAHVKYGELEKNCPAALDYFAHMQAKSQPIDHYRKYQPNLDGLFADWAVQQGHQRHNHLHVLMGLPYGGHLLPIDVDIAVPQRLGLKPRCYVTLHDGWDNNVKLTSRRPTKALPWETWATIVQNLKTERPDLVIVQLGGNTGAAIPGVDFNLKEKLTLSDSTSVLAFSALHLDVESGLVHLAAALGVKSVVMFGPTNVEWFGYPENINVAPKKCGNCWRSTDTWMDRCPLTQAAPICMESVDAKEIVRHMLSVCVSR